MNARNPFLAKVKQQYNKPIYKKVLDAARIGGESAGRDVLYKSLNGWLYEPCARLSAYGHGLLIDDYGNLV